jgi:rifampicin phosphotransferase
LVLQKLFTDNRRLLEAKRRAALLTKAAKSLPEDSPRRRAFLRMIAPVNFRLLLAGMVPVALLLGPLVVSFAWLKDRMDPLIPHGLAGSSAQIVAMVDGDCAKPVQIGVPAPLALDETTPGSRTLPPIRKTLEHLLTLYQQPHDRADLPWELQLVPDAGRQQTADDLRNYLEAGIPPRGITWMIRTPAGTVGRFPVTVTVEGSPAVTATLALGDQFPPGNLTFKGSPNSPVRELKVVYPPSGQKPIFWQPFSGLAAQNAIPLLGALVALNVGWLWLYILIYLPVLFIARSILRVA